MKNRACIVKGVWAFILFVFLLSGCGSSPAVKYYTLNTLPGMQQDNTEAASGDDIAVGVGPVDFPKFLDRPQIVTRKGQNQVEVSEFHRWAASLPGDFSRILAKNISTLLPTNRVAVYPWDDTFSPTHQIKLDVEQFDGKLDDNVLLNVTWSVVGQEGKKELVVRKSLIEEPVPTKDYDGLVAAQSNALAALSREIVEEIRRLK
ncbi:MAG: PqiC family protein [Syntrophobacterales bacterium]|jgi:hypothetical protein